MLSLSSNQVQQLECNSLWMDNCFPNSAKYIANNMEDILNAREWEYYIDDYEYTSIVDMVFTQIFPSFKQACSDYYKGCGKKLVEYIIPSVLKYYDREMCKYLKELIKFDY